VLAKQLHVDALSALLVTLKANIASPDSGLDKEIYESYDLLKKQ